MTIEGHLGFNMVLIDEQGIIPSVSRMAERNQNSVTLYPHTISSYGDKTEKENSIFYAYGMGSRYLRFNEDKPGLEDVPLE